MKLKSPEEVFRFVMSEIWSEMNHINDSLQATVEIECASIGFKLHLKWRNPADIPPFQKYYTSKKITLTELCDANFSMTSWLRTFIAESKIRDDCPVMAGYRAQAEKYKSP